MWRMPLLTELKRKNLSQSINISLLTELNPFGAALCDPISNETTASFQENLDANYRNPM
jgi:hypothetical protein